MDVGTPTILLDTPLTDGQPLALLLVGLLLALLGLNLWLLVDRARRRRAERELFARLVVHDTARARAQMAAAGGPATPRGRGAPPAGGNRVAGPPPDPAARAV